MFTINPHHTIMNNKQKNKSGSGHDVSPENTSFKNSSTHLTYLNNFMNITTHNVQGLSTTMKQQQLNTFLLTNKIDIIGISETKLSAKNAKFLLKMIKLSYPLNPIVTKISTPKFGN